MMSASRGTGFLPALAALLGNTTVTALKWVGFFVSGSSALFAEAVHSLADTGNQALLLIGIIRARRAPTQEFAYGYGRERFFWALISACGIFFAGAGVTIYHGLESLTALEHADPSPLSFVILLVALIVEAATLAFALRDLARTHPKCSWRERFHEGDPVTLAVIYEDAVAVLGVIVALASIWLVEITGNPHWDACGSLLIGVMLAGVAVMLIKKNREYLLERSIPEVMRRKIVKMLEQDPIIEKVLDFKSSILGIDEYRVKCEVELNGSALFHEMREREFISAQFEDVANDHDEFVRFCVEYADRIPRIIGEHINRVEAKIQRAFPSVHHIDIELN